MFVGAEHALDGFLVDLPEHVRHLPHVPLVLLRLCHQLLLALLDRGALRVVRLPRLPHRQARTGRQLLVRLGLEPLLVGDLLLLRPHVLLGLAALLLLAALRLQNAVCVRPSLVQEGSLLESALGLLLPEEGGLLAGQRSRIALLVVLRRVFFVGLPGDGHCEQGVFEALGRLSSAGLGRLVGLGEGADVLGRQDVLELVRLRLLARLRLRQLEGRGGGPGAGAGGLDFLEGLGVEGVPALAGEAGPIGDARGASRVQICRL